MAALSALAIVAQKAITPEGQKAIPTALLVADLERTHLEVERSQMAAEDRSAGMIRRYHATEYVFRTIQEDLEDELEERLDERDNALDELYDVRRANDMMVPYSTYLALRSEHDHLAERLEEAERANESLVRALEEQARSHQRADTEVEARHKRHR